MPKGRNTPAQSAGLAYERKVISALADAFVTTGLGFDLSHNPWFEYELATGKNWCIPDAMLSLQGGEYENIIFVIEIKLTYTPEAIEKLNRTYCPVVEKAFGYRTVPVVICKNLVPGAPRAMPTFFGAIDRAQVMPYPFPLVQWLGNGRLPLGLPETVQHARAVNR